MLTGLGITVVVLLVMVVVELYILIDFGIGSVLSAIARTPISDQQQQIINLLRSERRPKVVAVAAMSYAHRYMGCKNPHCGSPIQLPHPTIASINPNQEAWPRKSWKESFLCFYCGHIYEYSDVDVQHCLESTHNPYEAIPYETYSIRFDCDEYNCGTSTTTHVIVPVRNGNEEPEDVIRTISGSSRHWLFQYDCPSRDHSPKLPKTTEIEIRRCLFPS